MDKSGTDEPECSWKVMSAGCTAVAGAIKSLVNARSVQLECARVFHESLLVSILMYGSESIKWREKDMSRILAAQMDNLRGLLGIRRLDKVIGLLRRSM